MHEAIAQKAELSGADHKYLNFLIQSGPLTAGDLAKVTGLTTGAITSVIDRLENKGLVKREFLQNDRRKVMIVADVEKAQTLLGPSFQLVKEKILSLVLDLTDQEAITVKNFLNNAIHAMQEITFSLRSDEK
ncbi:MarR family transcriptional regulator [Cytophagaceae bacterium SJW1-29]|uniref:MarR family transcriptional regulator n=2 Tax=Salmonirosea aquatica TaxID=2654236 RepID=A0A7C9BMI2_9BACT|nr:MarR family transcriptional regulator [Cytophagaceae bacterium SJW1-29]